MGVLLVSSSVACDVVFDFLIFWEFIMERVGQEMKGKGVVGGVGE
jgi:hypothetical protein